MIFKFGLFNKSIKIMYLNIQLLLLDEYSKDIVLYE